MPTQKRKRVKRLAGVEKTELHKITHKRRQESRGNARYGVKIDTKRDLFNVLPERQNGNTFDQEYKTYHQTRGRQGLCPDPARRQDENPIYLQRNSVFNVRRVPIGELMSRPVSYRGRL